MGEPNSPRKDFTARELSKIKRNAQEKQSKSTKTENIDSSIDFSQSTFPSTSSLQSTQRNETVVRRVQFSSTVSKSSESVTQRYEPMGSEHIALQNILVTSGKQTSPSVSDFSDISIAETFTTESSDDYVDALSLRVKRLLEYNVNIISTPKSSVLANAELNLQSQNYGFNPSSDTEGSATRSMDDLRLTTEFLSATDKVIKQDVSAEAAARISSNAFSCNQRKDTVTQGTIAPQETFNYPSFSSLGDCDQTDRETPTLLTPSIASSKRLEWDSGADIGYNVVKVNLNVKNDISDIARSEPEGISVGNESKAVSIPILSQIGTSTTQFDASPSIVNPTANIKKTHKVLVKNSSIDSSSSITNESVVRDNSDIQNTKAAAALNKNVPHKCEECLILKQRMKLHRKSCKKKSKLKALTNTQNESCNIDVACNNCDLSLQMTSDVDDLQSKSEIMTSTEDNSNKSKSSSDKSFVIGERIAVSDDIKMVDSEADLDLPTSFSVEPHICWYPVTSICNAQDIKDVSTQTSESFIALQKEYLPYSTIEKQHTFIHSSYPASFMSTIESFDECEEETNNSEINYVPPEDNFVISKQISEFSKFNDEFMRKDFLYSTPLSNTLTSHEKDHIPAVLYVHDPLEDKFTHAELTEQKVSLPEKNASHSYCSYEQKKVGVSDVSTDVTLKVHSQGTATLESSVSKSKENLVDNFFLPEKNIYPTGMFKKSSRNHSSFDPDVEDSEGKFEEWDHEHISPSTSLLPSEQTEGLQKKTTEERKVHFTIPTDSVNAFTWDMAQQKKIQPRETQMKFNSTLTEDKLKNITSERDEWLSFPKEQTASFAESSAKFLSSTFNPIEFSKFSVSDSLSVSLSAVSKLNIVQEITLKNEGNIATHSEIIPDKMSSTTVEKSAAEEHKEDFPKQSITIPEKNLSASTFPKKLSESLLSQDLCKERELKELSTLLRKETVDSKSRDEHLFLGSSSVEYNEDRSVGIASSYNKELQICVPTTVSMSSSVATQVNVLNKKNTKTVGIQVRDPNERYVCNSCYKMKYFCFCICSSTERFYKTGEIMPHPKPNQCRSSSKSFCVPFTGCMCFQRKTLSHLMLCHRLWIVKRIEKRQKKLKSRFHHLVATTLQASFALPAAEHSGHGFMCKSDFDESSEQFKHKDVSRNISPLGYSSVFDITSTQKQKSLYIKYNKMRSKLFSKRLSEAVLRHQVNFKLHDRIILDF